MPLEDTEIEQWRQTFQTLTTSLQALETRLNDVAALPSAKPEQVTELSAALQSIQTKLSELEARAPSTTGDTSLLTALTTQLSQLTETVAELKAAKAPKSRKASVAAKLPKSGEGDPQAVAREPRRKLTRL